MTSTTRKQWLWFIGLWFGGLAAALTLGYGVKFALRLLGLLE